MYARDYEEPPQVVHLWAMPEEEYAKYREPMDIRHIVNRALCIVGMLLLFAIPSGVDVSPWRITVPLESLPIQTLSASVVIKPTGTNVVPATSASGVLTISNGSILVQQLRSGFIVMSSGGVEVVTDATVTIPASDGAAFGVARVQAHAVVAGQAGDIPALAINATYGTSLYLKNLAAFSGGADARTEQVATDSDKQQALSSARHKLHTQTARQMLNGPCNENVTQSGLSLSLQWSCQFMRYTVPGRQHVLNWQRVDRYHVVLEVRR